MPLIAFSLTVSKDSQTLTVTTLLKEEILNALRALDGVSSLETGENEVHNLTNRLRNLRFRNLLGASLLISIDARI